MRPPTRRSTPPADVVVRVNGRIVAEAEMRPGETLRINLENAPARTLPLPASYEQLVRELYACRDCRVPGSPQFNAAFSRAVDFAHRPPEFCDSPARADILIVSLNPKLHRDESPPGSFDAYFAPARRTHGKGRAKMDPRRRFVPQVEKVVNPLGYSMFNATERTVGNTRVCKCPTDDWRDEFESAARHCASKFLEREIAFLQPRVLWVAGKSEWRTILPRLGIHQVFLDAGPHEATARIGDRTVPTVISSHVSRVSDAYLADVRKLLAKAL